MSAGIITNMSIYVYTQMIIKIQCILLEKYFKINFFLLSKKLIRLRYLHMPNNVLVSMLWPLVFFCVTKRLFHHLLKFAINTVPWHLRPWWASPCKSDPQWSQKLGVINVYPCHLCGFRTAYIEKDSKENSDKINKNIKKLRCETKKKRSLEILKSEK